MRKMHFLSALALCFGMAANTSAADLKVGFITSLSGHTAAQGVPYSLGMKAVAAAKPTAGDHAIELIVLDDTSNPSTAARNARKLIEEDKVDVLIGGAGVPTSMAIAAVALETNTPHIAMNPIFLKPEQAAWTFSVIQPTELMADAILERMKRNGVKTIGYVGFSDAWGDLMYSVLNRRAKEEGLEVVTNERYARADSSVTGQILKVIAAKPDAVVTGTAGSAGALPYRALKERGYTGGIYGTHALINTEFVRVAGDSIEGMLAPTGPVIVADQLPADNPVREQALAFQAAYQKANNAPATDAYSAYAYDAWLLFADAAARAAKKAEPGSPEFKSALRDALASTTELVGAHGVYNFKPGQIYGVDERSRVIVEMENGDWKLAP